MYVFKNSAKNSIFVQKETNSSITSKVNFKMTLDVNFILIFLKVRLANTKKQRKLFELFL
jgi:hypothetical protein